jgi:HSP20 family protein
MAQSRPNPFRGLHDLLTEMERMRDVGRSGAGAGGGGADTEAGWVPAADIFAADGDLVIRLDIPGVTPDDIGITFGDGLLTISGERRSDLPDGVVFYTRERRHGPFQRSMTLPDGVDEDMITASFEYGVAEITVTGAARSAEPSRIPIEDRSRRATRTVTRRPR